MRSVVAGTSTLNLAVTVAVVLAFAAMASVVIKLPELVRKSHSPVEKAALAAAGELSKIVVNTSTCGYVSLADHEAAGKGTLAKDGYPLPVRGINSLIGTARLGLIIADKLDQSLMEEFAEQDLKLALSAKDDLLECLEKSLKKGGKASDYDGAPVRPYKAALAAYREAGGKDKQLSLAMGSLEGGSTTSTPVPNPEHMAPVGSNLQESGFYRAFVNIPYKDISFVFGGFGREAMLVDGKKWRARIPDLSYQFPTIVKVETGNGKEIACAQPGAQYAELPSPGALTITFPDGPVPEIKHPGDCYRNESLNSADNDTTDLLTASGGDYPVDGGSHMAELLWPLTGTKSNESPADVWRLALHDWIRRAGPEANIGSIISMQDIELDRPKPSKIMWTAPLQSRQTYSSIEPISSGIVHIFEFDRDGYVSYRSKLVAPYPLYASSQGQLYCESFGAIKYSDIGLQAIMIPLSPRAKRLTMRAAWDVYIRDEVRRPGTVDGGKHAGQPVAMPVLASGAKAPYICTDLTGPPLIFPASFEGSSSSSSSEEEDKAVDLGKGLGQGAGRGLVGLSGKQEMGYLPLISPQSDFGEAMSPPPPFVRPMPFGNSGRPFSRTSGTAVDIKFRRQIDVTELNGFASTGYIGITGEN